MITREMKDRARRLAARDLKSGNLARRPCQHEGCSETEVEMHHEDGADDRPSEYRGLLARESCARRWRSYLATKILVSEDDELVGRVGTVLGAPQSAKSFAAVHSLTWIDSPEIKE